MKLLYGFILLATNTNTTNTHQYTNQHRKKSIMSNTPDDEPITVFSVYLRQIAKYPESPDNGAITLVNNFRSKESALSWVKRNGPAFIEEFRNTHIDPKHINDPDYMMPVAILINQTAPFDSYYDASEISTSSLDMICGTYQFDNTFAFDETTYTALLNEHYAYFDNDWTDAVPSHIVYIADDGDNGNKKIIYGGCNTAHFNKCVAIYETYEENSMGKERDLKTFNEYALTHGGPH
jgi:hypothetical protein